jgi:hypothetical protein
MLLWHCTRLEYLTRILKEGLKAFHPGQRETKPRGVYLSEYQFNWMWNTTREGRLKGAAIQVDAIGLELTKDFHVDKRDLQYNSKRIGKDYICMADIGPERIRQVLIETEPNVFQPIDINEWRQKI